MDPNIERSGSFVCKKWTLFSVSLISIIWCTVLVALAPKLVDIYAQNSKSKEYTDQVKSLAKDPIMASAVLFNFGVSVLFNLLGLLGAYKQKFSLTMIYAVFKTSITFGLFVHSFKRGGIHWLYLVFNLFITVLAFAYARDLMIIRNKMSTTPIFMSPSQPQTIVQTQQQQYSSPSDGWEPPPHYNSEQYKTDKYYRFV